MPARFIHWSDKHFRKQEADLLPPLKGIEGMIPDKPKGEIVTLLSPPSSEEAESPNYKEDFQTEGSIRHFTHELDAHQPQFFFGIIAIQFMISCFQIVCFCF